MFLYSSHTPFRPCFLQGAAARTCGIACRRSPVPMHFCRRLSWSWQKREQKVTEHCWRASISGRSVSKTTSLKFILVAITYWITVNLVLAAYSIEQTTYAKVNATVALLTLEGKDEISAHDERRTRIDSSIQSTYPNHAWWWLQINSLQSLHTLRDVDLQRAIGRRQRRE